MSAPPKLPVLHPRDQIVSEQEIASLGLEVAPDDIGPSDDDEADAAEAGENDNG